MIHKRQILVNAILSVAQILVISLVLFVLYRFLLKTIGVEQLGIWSLILATTSVTQIANLGLSGSVVKFVAKYAARLEKEKLSEVIQTAALSVALFIGIILLVIYGLAKWIITLVVPSGSQALAISILPYALLAFWLMIVTSVFQAGLDGLQRIDLRSILLISGAILNLLLCFVLAPIYGLPGVAYARVFQNLIILLVSWLILRRNIPTLPVLPLIWRKQVFKEIVGYGISFQAMSAAALLFDPVTKALLSRFGGLSMLGYYEMASRMVIQLRALIVSASQVLIPAIADLKERAPERINALYLTSYQLLFYLALPLFSFIIVSAPVISWLWIGHYERIFVGLSALLAVGWFFNTLNAPAYHAFLGLGELRWNVTGQVTIALLNGGLGLILGSLYSGWGVVTAWTIALALGSSIVYVAYHKRHAIPLVKLLPQDSRIMALLCLILIALFFLRHHFFTDPTGLTTNGLMLAAFVLFLLFPFWKHPMRKNLVGWLKTELRGTH